MDSNESPPTYEATLEHHGIMPAQMQRQCSDEIISAVAPRMNDWRAIVLGVDKGKIDAIEKDTTDEEGKRRKFLECWKQKLGHRATCELLTRSFIQSGRADLADAVCLELQWKTVTTDGMFCCLKQPKSVTIYIVRRTVLLFLRFCMKLHSLFILGTPPYRSPDE